MGPAVTSPRAVATTTNGRVDDITSSSASPNSRGKPKTVRVRKTARRSGYRVVDRTDSQTFSDETRRDLRACSSSVGRASECVNPVGIVRPTRVDRPLKFNAPIVTRATRLEIWIFWIETCRDSVRRVVWRRSSIASLERRRRRPRR